MNSVATWPSQAESWLDARGKGAWIAAMVIGFIVFWPIGLALLVYMKWSKQMFGNGCSANRNRTHRGTSNHQFASSGNMAFDAYKADTLRRLEEEQGNFEEFLKRLREAKDKSEFDDFMEERARMARETSYDDAE